MQNKIKSYLLTAVVFAIFFGFGSWGTSFFQKSVNINSPEKISVIKNQVAQVSGATISPTPAVPEPFNDYVIPVPLRTVYVRTNTELLAAINDRRAGDRIVLSPGVYNKIDFGYNIPSRGTAENPIQFFGEDGVFVNGADMIGSSHLIFYDIDFLDTFHTNLGASNYKFINCGSILDSASKDNFYSTNNAGGDFQWINCWIQNSWRPGKPNGGYGIHMAPGQHLPDNIRIAGNVFTGIYRDGIGFGDLDGTKVPTRGVVIERNFFYYIEDDAIEMDKWFEGAIIRDNVIGGRTATMVAGISVAPGGPGPVSITGNSIAGYDVLPIKFNTEVQDADTNNVTISNNAIVHTSRSGMIWYFAIPVKLLRNLTIRENIITGTGSLYFSENTWNPAGTIIDYNRVYTTMQTAQYGAMFRMWDPTNTSGNGNIYSYSLAEFKLSQATRNGFSQHDVWDPTLANPVPVQIGNLPIDLISRWSFNGTIFNPSSGEQTPPPVNPVVPPQIPQTAPTLYPIGNKTVVLGSSLNFNLQASSPNNVTFSYSGSNLPSGASINSSTGAFAWTPNANQAGTHSNIRITVRDSNNLTDFEDITIVVSANTENATAPNNAGTEEVTVKFQYGKSVPALSIASYTGAKDTRLQSDVANAGYYEGGKTQTIDYRHNNRVGLYWFDLSAIPEDAEITEAKLQLYSISNDFDEAGQAPIYVVETKTPNNNISWLEGVGVGIYDQYGGTSWLKKSNIINPPEGQRYTWSDLSGRHSQGDLASAYQSSPAGQMNFVRETGIQESTDLSQTVNSIIDNGNNYEGFAVDMQNGSGRKDTLATKEYSNVDYRPALEITYRLAGTENTTAPATNVDLFPPSIQIDSPSFSQAGGFIARIISTGRRLMAQVISALSSPHFASIQTYNSTKSPISLSGSSADEGTGVASVSWQTDRGYSGQAEGTSRWSIRSIPLESGKNTIIITARDQAGNNSSASLAVNYSVPVTSNNTTSNNAPRSSGGGGGGGGGGSANTKTVTSVNNNVNNSVPLPNLPSLVGPFAVGMKSAQVTVLQQYLASDPSVYPEKIIDGVYSSTVTKAVSRFQQKYGIQVTGVAGPLTRAKIAEVYRQNQAKAIAPTNVSPYANLSPVEKASLIKQLTQRLYELQKMLVDLLNKQIKG